MRTVNQIAKVRARRVALVDGAIPSFEHAAEIVDWYALMKACGGNGLAYLRLLIDLVDRIEPEHARLVQDTAIEVQRATIANQQAAFALGIALGQRYPDALPALPTAAGTDHERA